MTSRLLLALLAVPLLAAAGDNDAFTRTVAALGAAANGGSRAEAAQALAEAGARPADGGEDLAAAWAKDKAPIYRNRALGPAYRVVALKPGSSATFEQTFLAGQRARIAVVAVGKAAFRLAVVDEDGAPQCGAAPAGRCDWVPLWTSRVRIVLDNAGATEGSYYLVME